MVGKELQVDEITKTLLCNVHPLMMFQAKMKEIYHDIHNSLGNKAIVECFLVDIEFKHESFVIKSLKCLSNFINNNYSSKPWNRSGHLASFIAPKENRPLSLKDHHLNRISECALALLYHLDDIHKYLDKFTNIINGMFILDRTFADMEILQPTYAALGLLGIHILKPYHELMMVKKTNYSTLIKAFLILYNELKVHLLLLCYHWSSVSTLSLMKSLKSHCQIKSFFINCYMLQNSRQKIILRRFCI